MNIPKNLFHIWIGPLSAPVNWMNTWPNLHPDWQYQVIDNQYLETADFYNRAQIDAYIRRGMYAGAADLIRYELLHRHGGFVPPADAVCLLNTDLLWVEPSEYCYTVYENEQLRPGYVSPVYAAGPGNEFLEVVIETLHALKPTDCISPWRTTGNAFLARMIEQHQPKIKIFPSHYFIPKHVSDAHVRYSGSDPVYADQMWGTTRNCYPT
jgi:mannosyltransferase OCH1-like enzyme